jgi:hypothetical protein
MIGDDDADFQFERMAPGFLSASLEATAKSKELIELARFGFVEVENLEKGVGHNFEVSLIIADDVLRVNMSDLCLCIFVQPYHWTNPTW